MKNYSHAMHSLFGSRICRYSLPQRRQAFAPSISCNVWHARDTECIFVHDPVKGCEPPKIASFADRVPKIRMTSDPRVSSAKLRCRSAMLRVDEYMLRKPNEAEVIWASIDANLVANAASPRGKESDRNDLLVRCSCLWIDYEGLEGG